MTEKNDINALRSSLESNKTALNIALCVGSITILTAKSRPGETQVEDIDALSVRTATTSMDGLETGRQPPNHIKVDGSRIELIRAELAELHEQLSVLQRSGARNATHIQQMLQSSQEYVTAALQPIEPLLRNLEFTVADHRSSPHSPELSLVDAKVHWYSQPVSAENSNVCPYCGAFASTSEEAATMHASPVQTLSRPVNQNESRRRFDELPRQPSLYATRSSAGSSNQT